MDLSTMTLADAEALAVRLETAARTIRDALAMMGGQPAPVQMLFGSPVGEPGRTLPVGYPPIAAPVLLTNKGPVRLTDEEQAQKDALRRQREADELEADMKRVKGA